jgi:hypothetical protein
VPYLSESASIPTGGGSALITFPLSNQILKALTLIQVEPFSIPSHIWAEIGIMSGGTNQANKTIVFSADYFGYRSPLSWTGSMPQLVDDYCYAEIISDDPGTFKLVACVYKIIATEGNTFRVDP